ncbi:MAG: hypothetical protein U9Q92_06620 [archaeon]|nr:hypothetical protein [archaeon]
MKEYRLKSRPEVSLEVTDLLFGNTDSLYYYLTGDYNVESTTSGGQQTIDTALLMLGYINLDSPQMVRTSQLIGGTDVGKDLIWMGIARAKAVGSPKSYGIMDDKVVQRLNGLIDDVLPEAREKYMHFEQPDQYNLGVDILDD